MAVSNFPNQIDTIKRLQDYTQSQAINISRYNELRQKPSLTSAEQSELASLRNTIGIYLLGAEDWNQVAETLESIQEFFKNNVDGYIATKQSEMELFVSDKKGEVNIYTDEKKSEMGTYIGEKQGEINIYVDDKVALFGAELSQFTNRGLWSNLTTYNRWNTVLYNYETYMSLQNSNLNNTPIGDSSDVYWQKMALRGAQGVPGMNLVFLGDYDNARSYAVGSAIFYNNSIYYCISPSTGNLPTDSTFWDLFLSNSGILVSTSPPLSPYVGQIFIDTSV